REARAVRDRMRRQRLARTRNHFSDALFVETKSVIELFSAQAELAGHAVVFVDEQQREIAHPQSGAKLSVDAVLHQRAMFLRPRKVRVRVVRLRRQERAPDSRRGLQSVMKLQQRVLERHSCTSRIALRIAGVCSATLTMFESSSVDPRSTQSVIGVPTLS